MFNELRGKLPREELERALCRAHHLAVIKTNEFSDLPVWDWSRERMAAIQNPTTSIIFLRYNCTITNDEEVSGQDENSFICITKIKFARACL